MVLRKAGDINDPYSIFTRLVITGRFDQVFAQLNVASLQGTT
jgi:hypothetical protein